MSPYKKKLTSYFYMGLLFRTGLKFTLANPISCFRTDLTFMWAIPFFLVIFQPISYCCLSCFFLVWLFFIWIDFFIWAHFFRSGLLFSYGPIYFFNFGLFFSFLLGYSFYLVWSFKTGLSWFMPGFGLFNIFI